LQVFNTDLTPRHMKRLNRLSQSIVLALSIFLLVRLFSTEEFTKPDYFLMIIDMAAGLFILIESRYRNRIPK
jgi:uncharacterized membrane protein YqhA